MRYVHLPASAVDIALLEDATRRGELPGWADKVGGGKMIKFVLTGSTEAATQASKK